MSNKWVLRDSNGLICVLELIKDFKGHIEIKSRGMIEVIFSDVDLIFVDTYMKKWLLL